MALEIERKFLVIQENLPELHGGQYIIQGYLSELPSIRYRFLEDSITITVKELRSDGSRQEIETSNPSSTQEERDALKRISLAPPIEKIRYRLPYGSLIWEVDVYQMENQGLITVDVEIPEVGYPLTFPNWVNWEREITNDSKYFNVNLARKPYTTWAIS
ncbi:inorganic triphosphatase [Desulfosporosinus acididurans]|uniref:Inorganic triphosphatase n=1 Tax=Desulfosporosinus acididurans TaxID=476652 RepID=A0A0J1FY57_9FIRM|nr:adenylate cyclase [Desulfosporosinus acididurans]KLU67943.1 inorganic triphosphatase [Desulfosporosinus acididurans]